MTISQSTDAERLQGVINWSRLSTNAFAKSIGYDRAEVLYRVLKGKNNLSRELAKRICSRFREVNAYWLFNGGRGKMIIDPNSETAKIFSDPQFWEDDPLDNIKEPELNYQEEKSYIELVKENSYLHGYISSKNEQIAELSRKIVELEKKYEDCTDDQDKGKRKSA